MSCVLVGDAAHRPLDPVHPGHALRLLARGQAAVWRRYPFTLLLTDSPATPPADEGAASRAGAARERSATVWYRLVRAVEPAPSVKVGTCVGRLAVCASGSCTITTARHGVVVQGIAVRHCHLLQRSDGSDYGYGAGGPIPAPGHSGAVSDPHQHRRRRFLPTPEGGGAAPEIR